MVVKPLMNSSMSFILAWLAMTVFGCETLISHPPSKVIPLSSIEQVTGTWQGLSRRVPDMQDDAWVTLMIGERAHFNFISNRDTGYLLGTGSLTILDGRAHGTTGRGTGTLTLHDKAGSPLLVVEVSLNDGHHYYVEMTRLK
jgi:hypothetical protein